MMKSGFLLNPCKDVLVACAKKWNKSFKALALYVKNIDTCLREKKENFIIGGLH